MPTADKPARQMVVKRRTREDGRKTRDDGGRRVNHAKRMAGKPSAVPRRTTKKKPLAVPFDPAQDRQGANKFSPAKPPEYMDFCIRRSGKGKILHFLLRKCYGGQVVQNDK